MPNLANMDLREYSYISRRPDTLTISALRSIQEFLNRAGLFSTIDLIDKTIEYGFIPPPADYEWHGVCKIILNDTETQTVIEDMSHIEQLVTLSHEDAQRLRQYTQFFRRCLSEKAISYEEYQSLYPALDLRNISLWDLKNLIFLKNSEKSLNEEDRIRNSINTWVYRDPEHVARLYVQIFQESELLLSQYPEDLIEAGLWFSMGGSRLGYSAYELVWGEDLSTQGRDALVESMFYLYSGLYTKNKLKTSCHMWWDSFAQCFYRKDLLKNDANRRIQDVMLRTLEKILGLESRHCQAAALHGLGHLRHSEGARVINAYLERGGAALDEHIIRYARACIAGDIM